MDTTSRVRDLVAPLITEAGVRLYDIVFDRGILRITVDRDGGVDIGTIGSLTRDISHLLDDRDPIAGSFTLEVSSPGLERNLRTPEHFEGAVGQTVNIKTRSGVEGDRRVTGTLAAADDSGITVQPAESAAEARSLAYIDIERARTVFDWGPAPKPGKAPKSPSSKNSKNPSAEKKAAKP